MEKECNHEALTNEEYIYTPTKSWSLPLNNPYVSLARTFRILQVRSYDTQSKKITCLDQCCWQGHFNSNKPIALGPEHSPKYPPSPPPQNPSKVTTPLESTCNRLFYIFIEMLRKEGKEDKANGQVNFTSKWSDYLNCQFIYWPKKIEINPGGVYIYSGSFLRVLLYGGTCFL